MKQYTLEYSKGLLQKTVFTLVGDTSVGRGQENTICLEETGVSRKHARLVFQEDRWVIQDLQSTNGTFINGRRVGEMGLRHGDRVHLGSVLLRFLESEPTENILSALSATSEPAEVGQAHLGPEIPRDIRGQMDLVKTFLDALPIGVAIINQRMEVLYWNQALNSFGPRMVLVQGTRLGPLLGCPVCEKKGISCPDGITLGQCPFAGPVKEAFERGIGTSGLELPWERQAGGAKAFVRLFLSPLPYSLIGEPLSLLMWEDVTERRRGEEALRESQFLSAMLDAIPIPTVVLDRQRRVVLWNRASESFAAIPRERLLGRPLDLSSLYRGKSAPILAEMILEMGEAGVLERHGHKGIRRDEVHAEALVGTGRIWVRGEERLTTFVATPLHGPTGEVVGAIQCGQDITEREQLQRQLRHGQKMRAVGTLAGGIAHEFNNILAAIQGYVQLMAMQMKPEDPLREYTREMEAGCQRAARLIRKIITFSRLDEGERFPMQVNPVVAAVERVLRQGLPAGVELELSLDAGLPLVKADPIELEQVLLGLGANARDAMPHGGRLRIETRLKHLDEAFCRTHHWARVGPFVVISVEDTGEGMPPQVLERVFEPFFTTKEPGKGTGLGLSVAYAIVKSHGGYILAESPVPGGDGQGSCVRVYLPVLAASPPSP
jgi:signal transduction histidine kinase